MASPMYPHAVRRLMRDQEEIIQSPVSNVSALPLESNMFEWHCNIKQDDNMYHVILYFPNDYPYSSPKAEFAPSGFSYNQGAIQKGKKGDQICLSIFSDFALYHKEWKNEKGYGWSPGYTAQTILLNVVSFLAENDMTDDPKSAKYKRLCQRFECEDCGHTFSKPYPSLEVTKAPVDPSEKSFENEENLPMISDYISKEKFDPKNVPTDKELFGYGLVLTQRGRKSTLTTPCEFLTASTFYGMKESTGTIHSVMKEQLTYFLPLCINKIHGSQIRNEFQTLLRNVQPVLCPNLRDHDYADIVLELIPNLMCSTVVEFSKGCQHTSDNSLQGYFALHRLFLWAIKKYSGLQTKIENRLSSFVSQAQERTKNYCPDIGQWLMLLSVSRRSTWQSVAAAYLSEGFKRNVMWYMKSDEKLGCLDTPQDYRIQRTFEETVVSRNLLAFQVAFLKIAKPDDMDFKMILDRYEANLGFPTQEMVEEMKTACGKIKSEIKDYPSWYKFLGLPPLTNSDLFNTLKESVNYAKSTKGYFFTPRYY